MASAILAGRREIILSGANSAGPTVFPDVTTTYYVNLENDGCINNDSVRVQGG